jgi:hypothetical protein
MEILLECVEPAMLRLEVEVEVRLSRIQKCLEGGKNESDLLM